MRELGHLQHPREFFCVVPVKGSASADGQGSLELGTALPQPSTAGWVCGAASRDSALRVRKGKVGSCLFCP